MFYFMLYLVLVVFAIIFLLPKKKSPKGDSKLENDGGAKYEHIPATLDYTSQSSVLDDSGATRTSLYGRLPVLNGNVVKHVEVYDTDATTLIEVMEKGAQRSDG